MMMKILVFGKNISACCGGQEKSVYQLVNMLNRVGKIKIKIVSGSSNHSNKIPYKNIEEIKMCYFRPLPYFIYTINNLIVKKYFRKLNSDVILAHGMAAPMAINNSDCPAIYFIHDESSLNVHRCYEKKIIKKIKFAVRYCLDLPFFLFYMLTNKRALCKAQLLVANSQYVATCIKQKFKKKICSCLSFYRYPVFIKNLFA